MSVVKSYHEMYEQSINDSSGFWRTIADELYFDRKTEKGLEWNFDPRKGEVYTRFMDGARTNIAYNCLERNIQRGYGSRAAFIWEGNSTEDSYSITYNKLLEEVIRFSAVLRKNGIRKGDVVAICLPMVMELSIAMLACARIGAIHTVIFAGYSSEALASRILQANANLLITCDLYFRGSKLIRIKSTADEALDICAKQNKQLKTVIVVEHLKRIHYEQRIAVSKVAYKSDRDVSWDDEMDKCSRFDSPVEWCDSEDPLFILYTSGTTGEPKGVVHTTAGYMVYTYATTKYVFDARSKDIFWCTADCGWITGHSFVVYGPLLNGLTSVIYEGIPTYPTFSRAWQIIEKYKVSTFYTSPTVIRTLMTKGDEIPRYNDRSSLRILATAGEPIDAKAWSWFRTVVGEDRCPVLDTYWQTEAGAPMITALAGVTVIKPGSACFPFFGVTVALLDENGAEIEGPGVGNLCFKNSWPSICRSVYNNNDKYISTYFTQYPGYFFTGDNARRDEDGYIWIKGRIDDLVNVSGHLLSTVEIGAAIQTDDDVLEVAVIGVADAIKGHSLHAYVILRDGEQLNEAKIISLKSIVRRKISPIAVPDVIKQMNTLPKTNSGKTSRQQLRLLSQADQEIVDTQKLSK